MNKIKIGAAVCLCAALTGVEALAANVASLNGAEYESLEAAVAAVTQPTDTITLLDDDVYLEPVAFTNRQFTLDGNGKTLAWNLGDATNDWMALSFSSNCVVNLKNLTIQTKGAEVAVGYNWQTKGDGSEYRQIGASGTLSNVRIESDGTALQVSGSGSEVVVEDCTFTHEGEYKTGASDYHLVDFEAKFGGRVTVKSGTYASDSYVMRLHPRGGEITLDGGTFTGEKGVLIAHIDGPADGWRRSEKLTVPFGSSAKVAGDIAIYYQGQTYSREGAGIVSLLGGTVSNAHWAVYSTGTSQVLDQAELKDAPCFGVNTVNVLPDGTLEIVPCAAAVGGKNYPTLEAAIEAAQPGDVVTVLADLEYRKFAYQPITISGKTLTIDGGDKTITWSASLTVQKEDRPLLVEAGSKVDIRNLKLISASNRDVVMYAGGSTGTLEKVSVTTAGRGVLVNENSAVTLKECEITRSGNFLQNRDDYGYAALEVWNKGTLDVESGSYVSDTNVVYLLTSGGTVNLKGGVFKTTAKSGNYALVVRQDGVEPTVINVPEDSEAEIYGNLNVIFSSGSKPSIQLKGGTYDRDPAQFSQKVQTKAGTASFIAEDYGSVKLGEKSYTVKLVKIEVDGAKVSVPWMKLKNDELPDYATTAVADYRTPYAEYAASSVNGIPVWKSYVSGVDVGEELTVTDFVLGDESAMLAWNIDPESDANVIYVIESAKTVGEGAKWADAKATFGEALGEATVKLGADGTSFYRVSVK